MNSVLRPCLLAAALTAACLASPAGAAAVGAPATVADTSDIDRFAASPLLPPDHWAVGAAARAEALGLAPGYLPAQRAVPRAQIAATLREASRRAALHAPEWAPLTAAWLRRSREEFSEYAASTPRSAPALLGGRAGIGYVGVSGGLRPAAGLFEDRLDPVPAPGRDAGVAAALLAASVTPWLAAVAEPVVATDGAAFGRWDALIALGPFLVAAGEQPVGYGPGVGGGVVLSGSALRRVGVQTRQSVSLPGPLAWLGPVSLHAFASRLREERHPGEPFFWGMRAAARPHPRLTVGVNRAAVFGGDSIGTPVTAANLARMFLGVLSRDFENQVVSADFRLRLPTEHLLPATVYLEWGAEDAAGGWWDVPGTLFGVLLPALPEVPQLAVGAEWTRFAAHCCGNPPWYAHAAFPGGWVAADEPLGHPLGGEGTEALLYANADLADAGVRLEGRFFRRDRRAEQFFATGERSGNLYAPIRAGGSWGASVNAAWRVAGSELEVGLFRESGDGWTEQRAVAGATVFLGAR